LAKAKAETAIPLSGLFGNSDEYMVIRFDANCLENLVKGLRTQWLRLGQYWRVPSPSSIAESLAEVGMPGNESVI